MEQYPKDLLSYGDSFIDINESYSNVKLLFIGGSGSVRDQKYVIAFNFPGEQSKFRLAEFQGSVFPNILMTKNFEGRFKELKLIFSHNLTNLFNKIYLDKKIEVNRLISIFSEMTGISEEETDALIKLSIAKGIFSFDSQQGGKFIKLSNSFEEIENKKRFLQAIADEIKSNSQRVELLIKHSVSKGNYREILLRTILKKYVPKKYEVATGFIEGCDRQCDIIIYDAHNYSPFFLEGELVVVPEKSVRAVIEVKSTLGSNELQEALDTLWDVARHRNFPAPFFKAVFAFSKGYQTEQGIAEAVYKFYHQENKKTFVTREILYLFETVNAICVLNEQCLVTDVIDYTYKDTSVRPRIYSIKSNNEFINVSSTTFFNELFSFLDVEKHAKKINIDYFKLLDTHTQYHQIKALYEIDWVPSSAFKNEHLFDSNSVWKRVSDVINWRAGKYNIQDLEERYFKEYNQPIDYKEQIDNTNIVQQSFTRRKRRK